MCIFYCLIVFSRKITISQPGEPVQIPNCGEWEMKVDKEEEAEEVQASQHLIQWKLRHRHRGATRKTHFIHTIAIYTYIFFSFHELAKLRVLFELLLLPRTPTGCWLLLNIVKLRRAPSQSASRHSRSAHLRRNGDDARIMRCCLVPASVSVPP